MHDSSAVSSLCRATHDRVFSVVEPPRRNVHRTLVHAFVLTLCLSGTTALASDQVRRPQGTEVAWSTQRGYVPEVRSASASSSSARSSVKARVTPSVPASVPAGVPEAESVSPLAMRALRWQERLRARGEEVPHGAAPAAPQPLTMPARNTLNAAGVYVTANSVSREEFLEKTMNAVLEAGGNALVFDVKGSYVYFDAQAPVAESYKLENPLYDLSEVLALAKEKGLITIGRFIAIKDDGFTSARPASAVRHPRTGQTLSYTWVDPADAEALKYNSETLCNLARAGIDEINLDYIRFSTENFGALSVFSGKEKADKVETFVRMARETIDRCGPNTKLGLSTYAILGWDYPVNLETLGQDVVRFAPLVDVISPMAYPATFAENAYYVPGKHPISRMYYLVYRTMTGYKELLGDHAYKLRPWIQGYSINTKNVQDQLLAVRDAGSCGFQFWNANNNYASVYAGMKSWSTPEQCE